MEMRIEGDPVSWARPRFNKGRGFTAPKQREAKNDLQQLFQDVWQGDPIPRGFPVSIEVEFLFRARRKMDIGQFKATKPDLDNLLKLLLDSANGILFWDDGQVVQTTMIKKWAKEAATIIRIESLSEVI